MVLQIIWTDILSIAHIFRRPYGARKNTAQILSCKKYSIGIKLSFSCDFIVPLITKYTQT